MGTEVPHELVEWIFSSLEARDLTRARAACKAWQKAFTLCSSSFWVRLIAEYPGGGKPNTKKGRATPFHHYFITTMSKFHSFMKENRHYDALRWAAENGHHALE